MNREVIDTFTKKAVDEGKLIEAGWLSLKLMTLQNASEVQIREMRKAFFAGAQHLWSSIFSFLEEGTEETPSDMKRMSQVSDELAQFVKELKEDILD